MFFNHNNIRPIKNFLLNLLIVLLVVSCGDTSTIELSENQKYSNYLKLKEDLLIGSSKDSLEEIILKLPEDTLKRNLLFKISYHYLIQNDSSNFRLWNYKTRQTSITLKDSLKIAESYWDLASFWYSRNITDSAYYNYNKAYNIYALAGDEFQAGRMMLSMAKMQNNIKDYLGSEISTIEALETFISLKKHEQIYSSYNNLGVIYNGLGEYEKSLYFHEKALLTELNINDELLRASSYNNIGVVYRNMKQYKQSIDYYNKAIKLDSLYNKNVRLYAMLIDNLAFSRLKSNDTLKVYDRLNESLKIRDSIGHKAGVITSYLHLGEYYLYKKDTTRSLDLIEKAKLLSEEYQSYGDLLKSLLILATVDIAKSDDHFREYISLSDSLQFAERSIRNKFTRIRFETDEFIAENQNLAQKNFWIITGTGIILILMLLLYIIKTERDRNRKLLLFQKQQLANEEIYNLLIDSQNKLDEGKEKEKKRISKELHDGILSKFFGVRLNLELLNDSSSNESITKREKYIYELKLLENEIRDVSHQLNDDMFSNENSFKKITKELLVAQRDLGKFQFSLDFDNTIVWDEISSKIKINIYRIIQEAIHNINKYSEAGFVEIYFNKENNKLKVGVNDNGVGFDTNLTSEGIGHQNMKSRVKELYGDIQIKSSNSGTEIIMYIPLNY